MHSLGQSDLSQSQIKKRSQSEKRIIKLEKRGFEIEA